MKENANHIEAFNIYYNLGEHRSLNAAARVLDGKATRASIGTWHKAFKWDERVKRQDAEGGCKMPIAAKIRALTKYANDADGLITQLDMYLDRLTLSIDAYFEEDGDGSLRPRFSTNSAGDLVKLIGVAKEFMELKKSVVNVGKETKVGEEKAGIINNTVVFTRGLSPTERMAFLSGGNYDEEILQGDGKVPVGTGRNEAGGEERDNKPLSNQGDPED